MNGKGASLKVWPLPFTSITPQLLCSESPDLMLMPHSSPTVSENIFISGETAVYWDGLLKDHAKRYSSRFGVPAIMVNKCGPWETPLPGLPMKQVSKFPGLSAIADSDGAVKAQLGDEEAVIVEDVILDPAAKKCEPQQTYGRWSVQLPASVYFSRFAEFCGKIYYSLSPDRKKKAREISSKNDI